MAHHGALPIFPRHGAHARVFVIARRKRLAWRILSSVAYHVAPAFVLWHQLLKLSDPEAMRWQYTNSLKHAALLQSGSGSAVMSLPKEKQLQMWQAIEAGVYPVGKDRRARGWCGNRGCGAVGLTAVPSTCMQARSMPSQR